MSARLTKLRIAGFKSFAEPVSLDILPGLTGIVGPNGCGKSNVVEALRWAMGETSARSLRGGEMDDVIFAGTTARASRNLAEVTVTVEAGADALPAPFETAAELQVTRRIERGAGSAFRANGRELRARDVQTLYADLASGARSSGMISQGRVADLVRARPEDRRGVLEEAAGITGLHARRSEAELKLRAAEQNLARSEDLRVQLDTSREGLRGQARQAARYRAISGLIRTAEAEHLAILHAQASAALASAQAEEALAGEARRHAAHAEEELDRARADAQARLPGPRAEEAAARTILERRRLEAETLAQDAMRAVREAEEAAARLRDVAADLAHGERSRADAAATVDRLRGDRQRQAARLALLPEAVALATAASSRRREAMVAAQAASDEAARLALSQAAAVEQAGDAQRRAGERCASAQAGHAALAREHEAAVSALHGDDEIGAAASALSAAEAALDEARIAVDQAETARNAACSLASAQRARAEQAAHANSAATQLAGEAAKRARRQRAVCEAAASALAAWEARCVPAGVLADARAEAEAARVALDEADRAVSAAEQDTANAQQGAATARIEAADGQAATGRAWDALSSAQARARGLDDELAAAQAALAEAERAAVPADAIAALQSARMAAEQVYAARSAECHRLEEVRGAAGQAAAQARSALAGCQSDSTQLSAEARGLEAALGEAEGNDEGVAALLVPDGLQAAAGAALGELGRASLDPAAPCFWHTLPGLPPAVLPRGSVALSDLVGAPAAFARVLSRVALLADGVDGLAVQADLAPGVVAVNRAGACWRWDGHVRQAGAPNWVATRLSLRFRLTELRTRLALADETARQAGTACSQAESDEAAAAAAAQASSSACRSAELELQEAVQACQRGAVEAVQADAQLRTVQLAVQRLCNDSRAAAAAAEAVLQELACLPDCAALEQAHRSAAALAQVTANHLAGVRRARERARQTADQAQEAAQTLSAAASAAEAQSAAASPALARAQAEFAALSLAEHEAQAARLALPILAELQSAARTADTEEAAARARETAARAGREAAEAELDHARQAQARLDSARLQAAWQAANASERLSRSGAELASAQQAAAQAASLAASLPDPRDSEQAALTARTLLEQARDAAGETETEAATLRAELSHAERAQLGLQAELDAWAHRLEEADARQARLAERHASARAAWTALDTQPAEIAARAARCSAASAEAEAVQAAAEAGLAAAEQHERDVALALRGAALQAGASRDRLVRAEAACLAGADAVRAVLARAAERIQGAALAQAADWSTPAEDRARRKAERLGREREEMGPVNLRADIELEALDGRIGALEQQRGELETAIAKLRGAIGLLNREGRERLTAVFTRVDQHFRTLFTRMMGGGRAHLALTGSEDPLAAGLEIYAEPPGKKLSALSLLSGGEQALTALSLIFAVFRCTPSPLCVLDEVDAPLDDANVERLCTLLDDVVRDTGTSFLVVTHHQLTMSRMDRLFGVTMQERGVSRLLSVDLQRAAAMAQPWLQAAE